MKLPLTAVSVVSFVTSTALFGMALGGCFGYVTSRFCPDFFSSLLPGEVLANPSGVAILLGSFGGVVCGGCLGSFAVAVQLFATWSSRKLESDH